MALYLPSLHSPLQENTGISIALTVRSLGLLLAGVPPEVQAGIYNTITLAHSEELLLRLDIYITMVLLMLGKLHPQDIRAIIPLLLSRAHLPALRAQSQAHVQVLILLSLQ